MRSWLSHKLDGDLRAFGLGYLLLLPLYLAPLLVARYLPGLDLPFHLSMVDMLNKVGRADNPYAAFYQGTLSAEPYAAHYWAVRLVSVALPIMTAHKVVVGVYVAGFPLAVAALLHACGRSRVPALLAFPLAYNLTLHYGFISFALSMPVLFLALATLTRFLTPESARAREDALRPAGLELAPVAWWLASALAMVVLFLCHLQNFLFGLCASAAFLVFCRASWRRRLLGLASLLPALALVVRWQLNKDFEGPAAAQKKSLDFIWEVLKSEYLASLGPRSWSWDAWLRLKGINVHVLRGFADRTDVVACSALLAVLVGYLLLGLLGTRAQGLASARPRMRVAGWITLLGALVAYLFLPHHLRAFELMTFYPRFSVLAVALAVLAIPASLLRLDGVLRPLVLAPALLLGGLYGLDLLRNFRLYDQEVADFSAAVNKTPPGGRALGLVFDRQSRVMRIESALVGLPALYPVLRPGPTSMAPIFYCGMRHMPCVRKPGAEPPTPNPWNPAQVPAAAAVDFFDYLFVRVPPRRPFLGAEVHKLELVAQEGTWVVYRRKAAPPPPPPAAAPAAPARNGAPAPRAAR